jgi:hypothetical protein
VPGDEHLHSEADWSTPVKIGDLVGTHPIGDPGNAAAARSVGSARRRTATAPNSPP